MTLENPTFGTVTYGMAAEGYDTWSFREVGSGGVVVLPFAFVAGALHVLVIRQHRRNQGGEVWNAPRGFLDAGETSIEAGVRELREETGYAAGAALFELAGAPTNPNSTFFETPAPDHGVRFCAVEVPESKLRPADGGLGWSPSAIERGVDSSEAMDRERIVAARFVPWTEAVHVADMFTVAAVARLLAHLSMKGTLLVAARP